MSEMDRMSLIAFLGRNRHRALADWERMVRAIPAAALLDREALRDDIPLLIDQLLRALEEQTAFPILEPAELHAVARLREGFGLEQLGWEYSALRSTLLRLNAEEGSTLSPAALVTLNDTIDKVVLYGIAKYHHARLRMLEALDRISSEGLVAEPQALTALLHRMLHVILEATESVDTAVLFLRDWDRLVLRVGVGIEKDLEGRFSLAVGEGFAGAVAASKKPLFTPSAETNPRVKNTALRMHGVRALYGVPLVYGDEVIGVAKMGSRTTSDFCAEDRLILRNTAERAAAFIAQRSVVEDRELFLHVFGHDLRSPLNTIVLGTASLTREPLAAQAKRNVERMAAASVRLERVIDDLADYTRTRATGGLPLRRETVDLNDLVRQLAAELQALHRDRELHLGLQGAAVGDWDRGRLLRLIANLVSNAMAYGSPSTPVTITVDGDGEEVTLRVHNEGPAIPDELQPAIFEAFKRGGTSSGTGLGLYIVQRIARAHGGDADVESAPGRGTTFRVRLPQRAPESSTEHSTSLSLH